MVVAIHVGHLRIFYMPYLTVWYLYNCWAAVALLFVNRAYVSFLPLFKDNFILPYLTFDL
jgi:hypothetical protein